MPVVAGRRPKLLKASQFDPRTPGPTGPLKHFRFLIHFSCWLRSHVLLSGGNVATPAAALTCAHAYQTAQQELVKIDHEICSHALVDHASGSDVKVSRADTKWQSDRVWKLQGDLNGRAPD
jgi:hypothetical protein